MMIIRKVVYSIWWYMYHILVYSINFTSIILGKEMIYCLYMYNILNFTGHYILIL